MPVGDLTGPVHTGVTVAATSTQVLAINAARRYATISNIGDVTVFIALGVAAEVEKGWAVPPGCRMVIDRETTEDAWLGDVVYGIAASGTCKVACAEVTR